ncbi:MAG TPA: hypothetical protein VLY87_05425 [Flavobacterium sp.]|nr:hypothetical protein [Flavobacterium sp.]
MEIIQAKEKHLEDVMEVINYAKSFMRLNGNNTQWSDNYPSKDIIINDICSNQGFVCIENNEILGYFCFNQGADPEPTYKIIENGKWLNELPYGVVHRLASSGKINGVAKACFDYCFSQINNIKVDTSHINTPMQHFFKKYGFTYCGIIYVNDGSPRDAFQKVV